MVNRNVILISDLVIADFNSGVNLPEIYPDSMVDEFNRGQENNPKRQIIYNLKLLLELYEMEPFKNPIMVKERRNGVVRERAFDSNDYKSMSAYCFFKKTGVKLYSEKEKYDFTYTERCLKKVCDRFEKFFLECVKCGTEVDIVPRYTC